MTGILAALKKYWFPIGLMVVVTATLADVSGILPRAGTWLKTHRGAEATILIIFFTSGIILNSRQIKSGLADIKGVLIALGLIFAAAPVLAYLLSFAPLAAGITIGLFLVAVMPSTLSSGVVMSGAAGGNMAHALLISLISNGLAVFSIPMMLSLLLARMTGSLNITIDRTALMLQLGALVFIPLMLGLAARNRVAGRLSAESFKRLENGLQKFNQVLVLMIVWMAIAESRDAVLQSGTVLGIIVLLVVVFHLLLLLVAGAAVWIFKLRRGRRESVIFMGCQKTLPLSILLQVALFPQYGQALAVCVLHHFLHLLIDGYLVEKLNAMPQQALPEV